MKVAIMGAGLAGLSCTYQLEKHCIFPTIFEQEYKVGARFPNTEAIMGILHHPFSDSFKYLAEKYEFFVNPINSLDKLVIHAPTEKAEITGKLGYITARGNYQKALEVELRDKIKSKIIYNSYHTLDDLKKQFDKIIVATGNPNESKRLGVWTTDVVANLIGVNAAGDFDPHAAHVWLDNDYAPKGYCFLLPYDKTNASLTLAVPGVNVDLDDLWSKFQSKVKLSYEVKDTIRLNHYEIGRTETQQLNQIYLLGNAGGFNMPFLGFGQFTSMLSGIRAANCLVSNSDYNKQMEEFKKDYLHSLTMRQALAKLDNNKYDSLVRLLKKPFAQSLLKSRRFSLLKFLSILLKPIV